MAVRQVANLFDPRPAESARTFSGFGYDGLEAAATLIYRCPSGRASLSPPAIPSSGWQP